MLWENLTAKSFQQAVQDCNGVCVLPLGVIEKHGDHLPLGTDMITGTTLCRLAAEAEPAIMFPYYFFGQIAEAMHYPGTISLSHKMIMENLLAVCDEIARNGLKKILIISSHGGNNLFLPFFAQEMPRLNRDYCVYITSIMERSQEQSERFAEAAGSWDFGYHAGLAETSMLMHLRPDLVHMDECDDRDSVNLKRLDALGEKNIMTGFSWYANYPNHFAGSPEKAKPALGKLLAEIIVENIKAAIKAVKQDNISHALVKEYTARAAKPDAGIVTRSEQSGCRRLVASEAIEKLPKQFPIA